MAESTVSKQPLITAAGALRYQAQDEDASHFKATLDVTRDSLESNEVTLYLVLEYQNSISYVAGLRGRIMTVP